MKTNSGSKGMAVLCFFTSALDRVCGQRNALTALRITAVPVPIIQKAEGVSHSIWTGEENIDRKGIRSSDTPVRSKSLF